MITLFLNFTSFFLFILILTACPYAARPPFGQYSLGMSSRKKGKYSMNDAGSGRRPS